MNRDMISLEHCDSELCLLKPLLQNQELAASACRPYLSTKWIISPREGTSYCHDVLSPLALSVVDYPNHQRQVSAVTDLAVKFSERSHSKQRVKSPPVST